jgi:hypothetical protein
MKDQIVAAFKKNKIVAAFKNQIVVVFIVGGAIIIAPIIFIVTVIRFAYARGIGEALARPVSEKLDSWRRGETAIARRRVNAVE